MSLSFGWRQKEDVLVNFTVFIRDVTNCNSTQTLTQEKKDTFLYEQENIENK